MNAKKAIISAILLLGSATLVAGGRGHSDVLGGRFAAGNVVEDAAMVDAQLPVQAHEAMLRMFGV